jgi:GH24 family phage-related lysozyme (muramidase)
LKKLSIIWNTVLAYLSGALILFVLFRLWARKKKISFNVEGPVEDSVIPTKSSSNSGPVGTGITFSPTPQGSEPTYEEYFNWLRAKENVTYTAKRDGQDEKGNAKFSIGMGHQILPNEEYLLNRTISEQEVRQLFKSDIEKIVRDVNSVVQVPLTRNQKLALVSIRYNVGPAGFRSGKLLSTLNQRKYPETAAIIPTFIVTSNGGIFNLGLQNRRKSEQALFLKTR